MFMFLFYCKGNKNYKIINLLKFNFPCLKNKFEIFNLCNLLAQPRCNFAAFFTKINAFFDILIIDFLNCLVNILGICGGKRNFLRNFGG